MKIGDKVKVVRKATSYTQGWLNTWVHDMDQYVGRVGTVSRVLADRKEVQIDFGHWRVFGFPESVVESAYPAAGTTVKIDYPDGRTWHGFRGIVKDVTPDGFVRVMMSEGPHKDNAGGFKPERLTVVPAIDKIVADSATTATIKPTNLIPVIGSRVEIPRRAVWAGEGTVESVKNNVYNIRMTTGQYAGQRGGFFSDEFDVLTVPVEVKQTIYAPKYDKVTIRPSFKPATAPASTQDKVTESYGGTSALGYARSVARSIAKANTLRRVTADQVQEKVLEAGYDLGNSAGSIFKGGNWKNTGVTVKSTRPGNNSRRVVVWEYVG
ncbi:Uncharacterised protein [uncultured archaeon]|nr:Uncharacterised protein [uncultured archaeon]